MKRKKIQEKEHFLSKHFGKVLISLGIIIVIFFLIPIFLQYIHYNQIKNKVASVKKIVDSHAFVETYNFPKTDSSSIIARDEDFLFSNTTLRSPLAPCEKLVIDTQWHYAHESDKSARTLEIYADPIWNVFWIERYENNKLTYYGPFQYEGENLPKFKDYYSLAMSKFWRERGPLFPVPSEERCNIFEL